MILSSSNLITNVRFGSEIKLHSGKKAKDYINFISSSISTSIFILIIKQFEK